MPALVTSKIPVSTPTRPVRSASARAPLTREWPKLLIGTEAPRRNLDCGSKSQASGDCPATTRNGHVGWSQFKHIHEQLADDKMAPTRKA